MPATTPSPATAIAKSNSTKPANTNNSPPTAGTLYIVCFAKMVDDKQDGIYLAGVYFGGVATSHSAAEQLAKDCVNTIRGGTIIPRIFTVTGRHKLLPTMHEAQTRFRRLEQEMMSAEEIISRSSKKH